MIITKIVGLNDRPPTLSSFRPAQSGDMFNRPTDCAVNPKTGDIFVADGYGVPFFLTSRSEFSRPCPGKALSGGGGQATRACTDSRRTARIS